MRQVDIRDAKTQLSKLLEEVEGGAKIVIVPADIASAFGRDTSPPC
jgi:antitoxin (DNA-binding transcriptional repressor) of toxin-antitoxin stability system